MYNIKFLNIYVNWIRIMINKDIIYMLWLIKEYSGK